MIVFDASTLILAAKSELLDVFLTNVETVVRIPRAVERECCGAQKTFDSLTIEKAIDESRIEVTTAGNRKLVNKLESDFRLGRGEAEAVGLALNDRAQLLCIDDKQGINACRLLSVPFTTALAILIRCREKRLFDRETSLARLALVAKYGRYKNAILEDARNQLEAQS
ncbi:MAG TPA: hypothetical protein VFO34_08295 [Candidatus Acidoferrales bacterium]|nr:hypothetical protein [Candidatus Acidoferrales bacterium]